MTSAAHIHAKCSVTIAEGKKIHCYSILLDQQNSALKKKKKKYYSPVCCSWKPRSNTSKTRTGLKDTYLNLILHLLIKCFWKWHRRRSNQYVCYRVSMSCTKLNNNCQSPHKKVSSRFPHCVPLTPGKIIHLNTFYLHLHKADKSIVLTADVLMHFTSPPDEQV